MMRKTNGLKWVVGHDLLQALFSKPGGAIYHMPHRYQRRRRPKSAEVASWRRRLNFVASYYFSTLNVKKIGRNYSRENEGGEERERKTQVKENLKQVKKRTK